MPLHDTIKPTWLRLRKRDGHLGGLYDPQRGIIRFISREGTIEYDLVALAQDTYNAGTEQRKEQEQPGNQ